MICGVRVAALQKRLSRKKKTNQTAPGKAGSQNARCVELCQGKLDCIAVCDEVRVMICGVNYYNGNYVVSSDDTAAAAAAAAAAATNAVHDAVKDAIAEAARSSKEASEDAKKSMKEAA